MAGVAITHGLSSLKEYKAMSAGYDRGAQFNIALRGVCIAFKLDVTGLQSFCPAFSKRIGRLGGLLL